MRAISSSNPPWQSCLFMLLADSVCDLTLRALRPQSSETSAIPLPRRISEAEEALRIGAGLG